MGGVLKSWAVPKGPSLNPADKRLAVLTEDHPLKYLHFEGHIPDGNYGAGDMAVWDTGTFECVNGGTDGDAEQQFARGKLSVVFHGAKLQGQFNLVRLRASNQWLLLKAKDEYADPAWALTPVLTDAKFLNGPATQPAQSPSPRAPRQPARASKSRASKSRVEAQGKRAAMPVSIHPMLATPAEQPPPGDDWLYEIKWDGYRAVAFCSQGTSRLISRNQIPLGAKFPEIESELALVPARSAILDGEIVVLDTEGRPSFQLLQNRAGVKAGHGG
jgi:bifunctional non-homologous end joining protein LigD